MAHNKILSVIFLICCQSTSSRGGAGDIMVNSGERAVLSCVTVTRGAGCEWLRDGYSLDYRGRYTLGAGACQLVIDPVLPLDQGRYQCRAGGVTSDVGSLKVNMAPGRPRLEAETRLVVDLGDKVELRCESRGGRPAGEILWWDEDTGERIAGEVSAEVTRTGGSFMTISRLRLRPKRAMSVKCSVHSDMFPAKKYSERLKIALIGKPVTVSVGIGDSVSLDCEEDEVAWSINGRELKGEKERFLEVENFVAAYDGAILECKANGNIVKRFELKEKLKKITTEKPQEKKNNDMDPGSTMKKASYKPTVLPDKYTLYSCETNKILGRKEIPDSVTIGVKGHESGAKHSAEDKEGQKYICKRFLKSKKVSQLRSTLRSLSIKVGKVGRKLENVS